MDDLRRKAQRLELLDDDLAVQIAEAARRALHYIEGRAPGDPLRDPLLRDALTGCLMALGGAVTDVSDMLRNFLTTVPWNDLEAASSWRVHRLLDEAGYQQLFAHVRGTYPSVIEELEHFGNPRTL